MKGEKVVLPLKRFLLVDKCPPAWNSLDLYLFRDDKVAFYAGQSELAFSRVWDHLKAGFHGHSIVGRFIWCNWPKSMRFTIEMLSSKSEFFGAAKYNLNAAEHLLIQQWSPCFNVSQNVQPTPLPETYFPPNAPFRRRYSLNKLIHQAERAVQAEDTKQWLEDME